MLVVQARGCPRLSCRFFYGWASEIIIPDDKKVRTHAVSLNPEVQKRILQLKAICIEKINDGRYLKRK